MNKIDYKSEILTSALLVLVLSLFIKPTKLLMPNSAEMMLTMFFLVLFLVFAALFWKEKSRDERENLHRLNAGRLSFLIGSSVLAAGIIFQSFMHDVDPWLVYSLIAMLLTKSLSRVYSQVKN